MHLKFVTCLTKSLELNFAQLFYTLLYLNVVFSVANTRILPLSVPYIISVMNCIVASF
jgi:hypothetical protein